VTHNWITEIKQFAPTLQAHLYAEVDREKIIEHLKAQDILICSYGLFQNNIDAFQKITWQIAVLDESQAIKNASTGRAKAAFKINAHFKLALTGTPIENHLGELWSLFKFLNPGLLGSEKYFYRQFVLPIEQNKDIHKKEVLKKMIRPFILRRTKNAVLKELPERIEQTLEIELDTQEMAFYETLREKAIENVSSMLEDSPGQRRVKILSEIMKLRQACCHPVLIYPDIQLTSSKLKHLAYLIEDLKENEHKALVFSQFVRYLKIVQQYCDEHQISYQYLDGQTPSAQRKQIVADFQNGKGDLF